MDNYIIAKYMKMFDRLEIEMKLEILSRITENIKEGLKNKRTPDKSKLLDRLSGSWSDLPDNLTEEIYSTRTISDKDIQLD